MILSGNVKMNGFVGHEIFKNLMSFFWRIFHCPRKKYYKAKKGGGDYDY